MTVLFGWFIIGANIALLSAAAGAILFMAYEAIEIYRN